MTLLVVLVAEAGVRAASSKLSMLDGWNDWEATNKATRIDELARAGGASIVVVGSSMMNAAADPLVLSQIPGFRRPAFNAALNGADGRLFDFWTLKEVVPRLHPQVVVIGVSSREMNDRGTQGRASYRTIRRSYEGRLVASDLSPTERMLSMGEQLSYLVRYRSILRRPSGWTTEPKAKTRFAVRLLGQSASIRALGETYQKLGFGVPRTLAPFSVGDVQTHALAHLVRSLGAMGIRVVLVEMPVSADIYDFHPRGAADYQDFERALAGVVADTHVDFINMTPSFASFDSFTDPFHVNSIGRERFTRLLADAVRSAAGP